MGEGGEKADEMIMTDRRRISEKGRLIFLLCVIESAIKAHKGRHL